METKNNEELLHQNEFINRKKVLVNFKEEFPKALNLDKEPENKPVQPQYDPLYGEKPVGYLENGQPIYKNTDIEEMYPRKKIEKGTNLRELQFGEIEKIKKEMKEKKDHRHLFFIQKGAGIYNSGGYFFEGILNQDVLALKNKGGFELKSLVTGGEIWYRFYSKKIGEWCDKKVPLGSEAKCGTDERIDLTNARNKYEFEQLIKSKK